MIYFTEITNDPRAKIEFQFYPKELPENISINRRTKLNKIEYNGGMVTNQIIGVYYEPIEWEGCFFGTYSQDGKVILAKDRAEQLKNLMGKPIRCVFAVPSDNTDDIPGYGKQIAKEDTEASKTVGHKGIYIMEALDITIHNYADVDYKITLVPHMRQEKIKPKEISVQAIKVIPENITNASDNIANSSGKVKGKSAAELADEAAKRAKVLKEAGVELYEYNYLVKRRNAGTISQKERERLEELTRQISKVRDTARKQKLNIVDDRFRPRGIRPAPPPIR